MQAQTARPRRILRVPDATDPIPLSFPQERVMFLAELAPESIAYNAQAEHPFSAAASMCPRCSVALSEIVQAPRSIFRTSIEMVDGRPRAKNSSLPAHGTLTPGRPGIGGPGLQREPRLADAIDEEIQQRFDLARGPAGRVGNWSG